MIINYCPVCGNQTEMDQIYPYCSKCKIGFYVKNTDGYNLTEGAEIVILGKSDRKVGNEDRIIV